MFTSCTVSSHTQRLIAYTSELIRSSATWFRSNALFLTFICFGRALRPAAPRPKVHARIDYTDTYEHACVRPELHSALAVLSRVGLRAPTATAAATTVVNSSPSALLAASTDWIRGHAPP
jgi:hypothetical protein